MSTLSNGVSIEKESRQCRDKITYFVFFTNYDQGAVCFFIYNTTVKSKKNVPGDLAGQIVHCSVITSRHILLGACRLIINSLPII